MTRAESKEQTRQRLLAQAQRLFRERGYAATSLEQIADAAGVTKGAIYGHFASKEDLMLSALEAAPAPDYSGTLDDQSRPLRERLAAYGRAAAAEEPGDNEELAVYLEFYAALLRAPDALARYAGSRERRLQELAHAAADAAEQPAGITQAQAWAIGQAMLIGLQIYKRMAPGLVTPEVFERTFALLADLLAQAAPRQRSARHRRDAEPGLSSAAGGGAEVKGGAACSSGSPTGHGGQWSGRRKKRRRSSTVSSAPSTCCSA